MGQNPLFANIENIEQSMDELAKAEELANVKDPAAEAEALRASVHLKKA